MANRTDRPRPLAIATRVIRRAEGCRRNWKERPVSTPGGWAIVVARYNESITRKSAARSTQHAGRTRCGRRGRNGRLGTRCLGGPAAGRPPGPLRTVRRGHLSGRRDSRGNHPRSVHQSAGQPVPGTTRPRHAGADPVRRLDLQHARTGDPAQRRPTWATKAANAPGRHSRWSICCSSCRPPSALIAAPQNGHPCRVAVEPERSSCRSCTRTTSIPITIYASPTRSCASRLHQDQELVDFALELLAGTRRNRPELDSLLASQADNWSLERMAVTDRNILRLASYEILYTRDTGPRGDQRGGGTGQTLRLATIGAVRQRNPGWNPAQESGVERRPDGPL